jgi:hypothetical protein
MYYEVEMISEKNKKCTCLLPSDKVASKHHELIIRYFENLIMRQSN